MATTGVRERHIAYKLLKQAAENPAQQNFVAFVKQDRMMNVSKHLASFINNPDSFMKYESPPSSISPGEIGEDGDGAKRREMVKTFALATHIHEEDLAPDQVLPFRHCPTADIELLG